MMVRFLVSVCMLGLASLSSFAASPSLGNIQPRGAQRGTEAVLTFQGGRLADTQEVMVYQPGVTVKKLEVVNDATVKVTVTIAPDCALGEHSFRLRTASGISDLRTFWIGALPVVDEVEPNNEFEKPQVIALNTTVHGTIGGEDVDYYVVECKKGQRLSAEVEGMRLGGGFWDPYIAILDSKRFELAIADDSALAGQDGGCSIVVPADGKYIIQIRESSYGGGVQYRLHVGNFPRPTAIVPAGGKPGDEVEVKFIGDPAGDIVQKIKLPATANPDYRLHCQTPEGISPTGFKFRLNDLPNVIELPTSAPFTLAGTPPCAFNGVLSKPDEQDYYKFTAKKGQVFDVHCYARRIGSPLDPVMHISNAKGATLGAYIAGNDDSAGPDSYLRFSAPQDGEYYVWLHDHLRKGGKDYFYRIELTPIQALTTTSIPKVDGNNVSNQDRQSITVPKGGRFATMVVANRADWGGPATVGFSKLPPGLTMNADVVDPGLNTVPVVFEAKADAPIGGVLADMQVKPVDAKVQAKSQTNLDVNFCIGLNNTPFHRLYTNDIAVAVTDAAPYSIEVIEPKSPVVQNGSMNLKVVAKRAAGFKGAITVYPLFTPTGTGIQGSGTIPENATEVLLPFNAAPNAAARKWKTAVIAVADAGKGPIWTSSQLFTLEVAAPFVAFTQERSAVEQGQKSQVFCKVQVNTPFEGKAIVKLIGLPAKAVAPDRELTKDGKEIAFDVTTDKTTPAGKHGTFCQVIVTHNGETIYHNVGGGEFRVDVPLPPKPTAAATPAPAAKPTPAPAQPAAPKRLTRLEQLRLEQEQREKAAKEADKKPEEKKPEEKKK